MQTDLVQDSACTGDCLATPGAASTGAAYRQEESVEYRNPLGLYISINHLQPVQKNCDDFADTIYTGANSSEMLST